jgi:ferritin-like protein
MRVQESPDVGAKVRSGDLSDRVGVAELRARGVDVPLLIEKLAEAAAAELAAHYRYTVLALGGGAERRELCETLARQSRDHLDACLPRILQLGSSLPADIAEFAELSGRPEAPAGDSLAAVLETERAAIRAWWEICDLTTGRDFPTCAVAERILSQKVAGEARLIEVLSAERDGPGA